MPDGSAILMDPFGARVGELRVRGELFGDATSVTSRSVQRFIREAFSSVENDLRLSPMVERYSSLLAKIDRLKSLSSNWDSYAAPGPSPSTRVSADKVVRRAFEMHCLPDAVVPSAEGGVAVCWDSLQKHAYIEFDNDGTAIYARYRENDEPVLREFSVEDLDAIDGFINDIRVFIR